MPVIFKRSKSGSISLIPQPSKIWWRALSAYGRIDILVSNAGLWDLWKGLWSHFWRQVQEMFEVNTFALMNLYAWWLRTWRKQAGAWRSTSSAWQVLSQLPNPAFIRLLSLAIPASQCPAVVPFGVMWRRSNQAIGPLSLTRQTPMEAMSGCGPLYLGPDFVARRL